MAWKRAARNTGKSCLRIAGALAVLLGVPVFLYLLWTPGAKPDGTLNRGENAIWLGHSHLGDDGWFQRYDRNPADFRSPEKIAKLFATLQANRIRYVYPHLCPAHFDGSIAPFDPKQVERFLDAAEETGIAVIPWVGGILGESARISNPRWREGFTASVKELLEKHPRLAGIQVNIEPLPSGNADFLLLLDELREATADRILGVAAYPPPTRWHPVSDVHWELSYLTEVARRTDQMTVMMYDTAIRFEKFYILLMRQWTRELQSAVEETECRLLLGVPAYEDAGSGYHHPGVEHLQPALSGIQSASPAGNYTGCAIYCEWEMTPEKWQIWRKFLKE